MSLLIVLPLVFMDESDVVLHTDEKVAVSDTLQNAEVIETEHQFAQMLDASRNKFSGCFKNEEEYQLFMMLPIPPEKRGDLLLRMSQDAAAQKQARGQNLIVLKQARPEGNKSRPKRTCVDHGEVD